MSNKDLKKEIEKIIGDFPDSVLEDLILYLRKLKDVSEQEVMNAERIKKILQEDSELLKKLAK